MAELADAPDLGSGGENRGGSSPPFRTNNPSSRCATLGISAAGSDARKTPQLRIWRGNPWGFESPLSHQRLAGHYRIAILDCAQNCAH